MAFEVLRDGEVLSSSLIDPGNAVLGGVPFDVGGSITIGIVGGTVDGQSLANLWGADDQEGGITVVDSWDRQRLCIHFFHKTITIDVLN